MKYDYSKPAVQCCTLEVMCHPMNQSAKHPNNFSTEEESISFKRKKNKQIQVKQIMEASYYQ